jgi:acylphosphatase
MTQIAKHVVFSGRVQGVGFRFTVFGIANRCNLKGLVRNLSDGTVEMIAQGEDQDIDICISDIKESFGSHIKETRLSDVSINPDYKDFKITF